MINPQLLELPISRTNFHGPNNVRAIVIRLYSLDDCIFVSKATTEDFQFCPYLLQIYPNIAQIRCKKCIKDLWKRQHFWNTFTIIDPVMANDYKFVHDLFRQLFSESQAKFVCATLMLGLKFLHENDIVHGGIMPRKIVFNDKYYPQLVSTLFSLYYHMCCVTLLLSHHSR